MLKEAQHQQTQFHSPSEGSCPATKGGVTPGTPGWPGTRRPVAEVRCVHRVRGDNHELVWAGAEVVLGKQGGRARAGPHDTGSVCGR